MPERASVLVDRRCEAQDRRVVARLQHASTTQCIGPTEPCGVLEEANQRGRKSRSCLDLARTNPGPTSARGRLYSGFRLTSGVRSARLKKRPLLEVKTA